MGTPVPIWTSAQLLQCIPNSTCTINLPCISDYFRITSSIALMAMNPIKSNHQLSPDAALVTGAASVIGTGSVATPGRASDRHKCEEHTWLGCNLTIYTLFSLSHRKLRPAIASTETSAMQWEARTRRPPNHFQLIEPEKGTTTIDIAPHKFMFCTYVTKRSHDSELSRICFLPVRAVRVPRKHLRQFRPRAYCDQWGVGGSGKTMKSSNASSSSTKSLAFHLNYWICKHVRPMEGFPTLVKELRSKPNILRLWPVHPARKWPCLKSNSLSPHSLRLDLRTAFLSCHTSWIIWQKGWRWDLSPQTVQRGQGTRHQLCHPPFSQGQHRHHMVWLSPSRGPRICRKAKPSLEICRGGSWSDVSLTLLTLLSFTSQIYFTYTWLGLVKIMGQVVWSTCLGPSWLKSNLGPWTWGGKFTNGCIMSLPTPTTSPVWFWVFWMGQWLIQLERGAKPVILQIFWSSFCILVTCLYTEK